MYRVYMVSPYNVRKKLADFRKKKEAIRFLEKNNRKYTDGNGFVWDLEYSEIRPEFSVADENSLMSLCVREGWFTAGTNRQYEKLSGLNRDGAPLDEIALVIWLCSQDVTREHIRERLLSLREDFCSGRLWEKEEN